MQINRSRHPGALALWVIAAVASPANSLAAYPERPIRWVVPGAAGSGVDAGARMISNDLSRVGPRQVRAAIRIRAPNKGREAALAEEWMAAAVHMCGGISAAAAAGSVVTR